MADFINATIEQHEFDKVIKIMKDRAVRLRPIMAVTGNMVVKSVRRNFREGGRPEKWEKSKKPKSYRGSLRAEGKPIAPHSNTKTKCVDIKLYSLLRQILKSTHSKQLVESLNGTLMNEVLN